MNDDSRELLLVIEGSLADDMMGELLELLESGTFILRKDGQVVVKERKVNTSIFANTLFAVFHDSFFR